MKSLQTSLFFAAVLGVLALCGSAWGVESSESIQGLISHWKFDESSGTTAYDSAGNNDGTVYGAQWTTGQINGALSFDGVDDYVYLGDIDEFEFGEDDFSISVWIYPRNHSGSGGHIITKYYWGNEQRQWWLAHSASDAILFYTNPTGASSDGERLESVSPVAQNAWAFITAVRKGSTKYIYINGELDTTGTTAGILTGQSAKVYIGVVDSPSEGLHNFFNGEIDEVRIYDKALSAEEIQQLYQGVFPELVGLEIVGPGEVAENFSASYKAIAHYDNDSTRDVTDSALWAVEPNTAANIDENGILRTKDIVTHQSATILASYTEGDVTFEAEKAVQILAICPTGTALQFDGVDDYVMVGDKDSLEPQELTLSFWAQLNNPSGHFQGGIAKGYVFGSPIEFSYRMDFTYGYLRAGITNTENAFFGYFGNFIPVGDNNWHMWTMTVGDSKVFIYKDGFIVGTTGYTGTIDYTKTHNNFVIGARDNGRYAFNGVMDEVAIYNRALSAEEIWANMHTRLTGDEPGLVGYWDLDEGEGQIVYDLSGNGNDGQLGSTPSPDVSDPAWVESDAPVGICTPYQIATLATERAVERKLALLEELLAALANEWTAYEALEEWLVSGDYGDLYKGDIVTAKQKIRSAIQHEGQSIGALDKSVEKLKDALNALGYEPNTAANIGENGVLTTKDVVKHQSATILASYTEGDVTVEAEKAIDILAICPIGTALRFDGVDDYVDFSKNIITTTEFTVSAWANNYGSPGGSTPVHNAIFQQRDDESRAGYAQSLILLATEYPGDYAAAIIRSSGGSSTQSLTYPKKNYDEWHQYSMTVDSTDFTFYIDGVEVDRTSNNQAGDYVTSIDYVSIGRHSYRGANRGLFNGAIDEVTIYNRALSAEEIWANMHRRLAGDEPGLVGYWDFDEGGGQIVYDLSGNGNDGQLGSTPNPDVSDPAWIESDAPIGICSLYQIATMAVDRALECKTALLEELLAALASEWTAYEALEELLESGDYGDLYKGDIVTAKQNIHSATQHGEQAINALEKSIEKLEDALSALGYEPEPPPPPPPPPGQASNPNPANGATNVSISADLSWTASSNAVSHDVYFGTTSPGAFRGNQTATIFAPNSMAYGATYYWRIDEVNASGTTTGTVWSFTTGGGGWSPPI